MFIEVVRSSWDVKPPILDFYRVDDGAAVEFKFSIDQWDKI